MYSASVHDRKHITTRELGYQIVAIEQPSNRMSTSIYQAAHQARLSSLKSESYVHMYMRVWIRGVVSTVITCPCRTVSVFVSLDTHVFVCLAVVPRICFFYNLAHVRINSGAPTDAERRNQEHPPCTSRNTRHPTTSAEKMKQTCPLNSQLLVHMCPTSH